MGKVSDTMTALANAVRKVTGKTGAMNCAEMLTALDSVSAGTVSWPKDVTDSVTGDLVKLNSLPASCKTISDYSFYYSPKLKSITIPNSVTHIGVYSFGYCLELETVEFSSRNSKLTIDDYAFGYCPKLETISIPGEVLVVKRLFPYWSGQSQQNNPQKLSKVIINEGTEEIADDALKGVSITELVLPKSLKTIGKSAVSGCKSLKTLTIKSPTKISTIGSSMFSDCVSLTSVAIPEGLKSTGPSMFNRCTGLVAVSLPTEGLTKISSSSFADCTNLNSINFPETLEYIESNAFVNCEKLVEFICPSGLRSIGGSAFKNSGLVNITLPCTVSIGADALSTTTLKSAKFIPGIDSKTGEVEDYGNFKGLFGGSDNLEEIDMSELSGVTLNSTFYGLAKLSTLKLPEYVLINSVYKPGESFKGLFEGCTNLKKVDLGSSGTLSVTLGGGVGGSHFSDSGIEEIIARDIKLSGSEFGAKNIKKLPKIIVAGATITSSRNDKGAGLKSGYFTGCTELSGSYILSGFDILATNLFPDCPKITSIYLTDECLADYRCFYGCKNLTSIYYDSVTYLSKVNVVEGAFERAGGANNPALTIYLLDGGSYEHDFFEWSGIGANGAIKYLSASAMKKAYDAIIKEG